MIQALSRIPQLYALTLADGCDAITNHEAWAGVVRHMARLRQEKIELNCHKNVNEKALPELPIRELDTLEDILTYFNVDCRQTSVLGRTVFYTLSNGEELAIKISKQSEESDEVHPLIKEAQMNTLIEDNHKNWGLKSQYPKRSHLFRIENLPNRIIDLIKDNSSKGYQPFKLSQSTKNQGIMVLVYHTPVGYREYINQRSLPEPELNDKLAAIAYDYGVLANKGLYHSSLVDMHHDTSREKRPHLWSFESFLTRFRQGAGRIEGGLKGVEHPNGRRSGLADLKHLITGHQGVKRYNAGTLHAQHNVLYDPIEHDQVALYELLGAGIFGITMLAASSWVARHENPKNSHPIDLPKVLENAYGAFLEGYLNISDERARSLLGAMGIDCHKSTEQCYMFCTDQYVRVAESAPRQPVFNLMARLLGSSLTHVMQGIKTNCDNPRGRLQSIHQLYSVSEGTLPAGYPHINTAMLASSGSWKVNVGWVNKNNHKNIGAYQGVLPLQAMIRDLYTLIGHTVLLKTDRDLDNVTMNSCADESVEHQEVDSDHKVYLTVRPLHELRVALNEDNTPKAFMDKIKRCVYRPVHTSIVVEESDDRPPFIGSAGAKGWRCPFADSNHPLYFIEHDAMLHTKSNDNNEKSTQYLFEKKLLPFSGEEIKNRFGSLLNKEQGAHVTLPRYGPYTLGLSNCQTRIKREIINPMVHDWNLQQTEKIKSKCYLPHYLFKEDVDLPRTSKNCGWH